MINHLKRNLVKFLLKWEKIIDVNYILILAFASSHGSRSKKCLRNSRVYD